MRKNDEAVDQTLARLFQVRVPETGMATSGRRRLPVVSDRAPSFVQGGHGADDGRSW